MKVMYGRTAKYMRSKYMYPSDDFPTWVRPIIFFHVGGVSLFIDSIIRLQAEWHNQTYRTFENQADQEKFNNVVEVSRTLSYLICTAGRDILQNPDRR